ncbi:MAG: hypothetical protein IT460_16385 [Planctomycetes bacterium]|nr:hypothetical protein [Planctomycetota bacterium]
MRSRWPLLVLAACLAAPGGARGADDAATTAADVTEPGRKLDRALDIVVDGSTRVADGPRTLAVLVDPTPSLKSAGFVERFAAALERHAGKLGSTELSVARVGAKDAVVLPPTADRKAVSKAVGDALLAPRNESRNVYADLRTVAGSLAGRAGAREVLLVTLENGDAEDDLEATVAALRRAKARTFVVATETFLSDSYFASHGATAAPRGTSWTGGEAAFHEVPWGWLFQMASPHEEASSGFPPFGLARVAAATEGRVFLHAGPGGAHSCGTYAECLFCTAGDHAPAGDVTVWARLKAVAPLVAPRDEVYAAAAKDPAWRAVHAAWKKAADAGLVRSRPSLDLAGGTAKPSRSTQGAWAPLTGIGLSFPGYATRASRALEASEKIRAELEADLSKIGEADASPRWRAVAELVRYMLLVTRVNLIEYVAWCQDAGPSVAGKKERPLLLPEVATYDDARRFVGVGYGNWSLCHGARPFQELHLPGGPALRAAIDDLDRAFVGLQSRYAGTPFSTALRRAAIARFWPTVQGKVVPPPPRKPTGKDGEDAATPTERPSRGGSGGSDSGPTTGG